MKYKITGSNHSDSWLYPVMSQFPYLDGVYCCFCLC